jgi:positive regulator of sigma E activity
LSVSLRQLTTLEVIFSVVNVFLSWLLIKYYSLKSVSLEMISLEMPVPSQGHFRLLTDFVCLYNYEFWLSLCKIVRSSVILLLPLFIELAWHRLTYNRLFDTDLTLIIYVFILCYTTNIMVPSLTKVMERKNNWSRIFS